MKVHMQVTGGLIERDRQQEVKIYLKKIYRWKDGWMARQRWTDGGKEVRKLITVDQVYRMEKNGKADTYLEKILNIKFTPERFV